MSDPKIVKLVDESSRKSSELPLVEGTLGAACIDIGTLYKDTGHFTYDPGFGSTASTKSAITYIDGDKGVLLYRGYPIEQLAEKSASSKWPICCFTASCRRPPSSVRSSTEITRDPMMHESQKNFFQGFHHDAHPMAMLAAAVASLSAFYHDDLDVENPADRKMAAIRLLAKMPTIAAACYRYTIGWPVRYPRNNLEVRHALPAHDVRGTQRAAGDESGGGQGAGPAVHPACRPRAECVHLDRASRRFHRREPVCVDRRRHHRAVGSRAWRRQRGGAQATEGDRHAGQRRVGDPAREGQERQLPPDGLRPSRVQDFDPRAKIIREMCHKVLAELGVNDPLLDVAMKLEEAALKDEYFVERKLYPNVDFYSGIIYKALGIPTEMFTVMFAIARTAGWIAHWIEQHETPGSRIGRPRQVYTGADVRDYVPTAKR
ncbi:Citrate synthase OS=Rhodanobacter lindaniclasticus OX=75310 GN=B1991_11460 PE=3 SV=1 [Rhodanobacter lindaniclasticus]